MSHDNNNALRKAAFDLYRAGKWSAGGDRFKEAKLWEALRDALGILEGTATAVGIGVTGVASDPVSVSGVTNGSQVTITHTCCWHSENTQMVLTVFPPRYHEVCCHCGERRVRRPEPPPIPEGHGAHYPQSPYNYPAWWTTGGVTVTSRADSCGCNPANGGSGVCGCILNLPHNT